MKHYFWLKLQADFFDTEEIRAIEAQTNGPQYICFWLKLLMIAIKQEQPGRLRLRDLPYTDALLASVTHTDIDTVRSAMKLFEVLGMVQIDQEHTLWIEEAQRLVGKETDSAVRMRAFRERRAKAIASPSDAEPSRLLESVTPSDAHRDTELELRDRERGGGEPESRTSAPEQAPEASDAAH